MAPHRVEFYLPFGAVCAELDLKSAEMKKAENPCKKLVCDTQKKREV